MGRQAYLTRLALGRSAFEPPERGPVTISQTPSTVNGTSQTQHQQLYDERGHPIDPIARASARRLRDAQNDVLAAIGVLERKTSLSTGAITDDEEDDFSEPEMLRKENTCGYWIIRTESIIQPACKWWIDSLWGRFLVFETPAELSFSEIIAIDSYQSGALAFFTAGFPAALLAWTVRPSTHMLTRVFDQIFYKISFSRKNQAIFQAARKHFATVAIFALDFAFTPLIYHIMLQRLHLVPAGTILPPLRAFIPGSDVSPLPKLQLPIDFSLHEIMRWANGFFLSPFFLIGLDQQVSRLIHRVIEPIVLNSIIRPTNSPHVGYDEGGQSTRHGLISLDTTVRRILGYLGWGYAPDVSQTGARQKKPTQPTQGHPATQQEAPASHHPSTANETSDVVDPSSLPSADIAAGEETSTNTLVEQLTNRESMDDPSQEINDLVHTENSHPVLTEDEQPSVRIIARDTAGRPAQVEVLMPEINSTAIEDDDETDEAGQQHPTEVATATGRATAVEPSRPTDTAVSRRVVYHRVTPLSIVPAAMLMGIVGHHIYAWLAMPIKLVGWRMIASYYLRGVGNQLNYDGILLPPPYSVPNVRGGLGVGGAGASASVVVAAAATTASATTSAASVGTSHLLSRVGIWTAGIPVGRLVLCSAVEFAIQLGSWGCHWVLVTWVGKRFFGWGRL